MLASDLYNSDVGLVLVLLFKFAHSHEDYTSLILDGSAFA